MGRYVYSRHSEALPGRLSTRCRGFSRVELLIVVCIVLLLITAVAPALPGIREWSRARQCQDNLRQIGAALASYHSTYATLPPASFWEEAEMVVDEDMRPARSPETVSTTRQNWLQLLLRHLGEERLASEFDPTCSVTDFVNESARTSLLAVATCPADGFNSPDNPYVLALTDGSRWEFARGNYAINGGSHGNVEHPGYLSFPVTDGNVIVFRKAGDDFHWWGNGVAGFNKCFSFSDFTNGLSTTVAVDEIRSGIIAEDSRGVWALGQIGASITWAHGVNGDDYGPNNQLQDSDDILAGKSIAETYGIEMFFDARMPFCAHCSYSNQATARSQHPGGVHVLLADGAVRFVTDVIDPNLWHVMHSRETPRDVIDNLDANLSKTTSAEDEAPAASESVSAAPQGDSSQDHTNQHSPGGGPPVVNSIGMRLVPIRPGTFVMGLPDAGNTWPYPVADAPAHTVRITHEFLLGVHEVTQREFETVMAKNPSWHSPSGGGGALVVSLDAANLPAENVTWEEAAEFCRRLSERDEEQAAGRRYRLPTEAEWEYACRTGSTEPHPFVADWPTLDDFAELAGKNRHPTKEPLTPRTVGSFPENRFGLYDMRGNIFEWTADWFERDYYRRSPVDDPPGPATGYLKVVRGWDWVFIGSQCKDFHVVTPPWIRSRYVGFRVAADRTQPPL